MNKLRFRLDSTPQKVDRLPFASESGLQQFIEDNSEELLDVEVVGSARKDGKMIFKIDLLAVDFSGRPWIIECKHDLVNTGTLDQLQRYREAVLADWTGIRDLLSIRITRILRNKPDPVVLIGYRYDPRVDYAQALCLAYRYHDMDITLL